MMMTYCVATRAWERYGDCVQTWLDTQKFPHGVSVSFNKDVVPALQDCYERSTGAILALIHDDVMIYEDHWDLRVLKEFDDPKVGMVGFTGALGHGTPDLYEGDYHLPKLARQHFMSNMRSAEKHGARFTGERDVAVCDACAVFVRRAVLDKAGGFPVDKPYGYWLWCEWLCCETRRQGYRIRLVGIDFEHLGGRTSTIYQVKEDYEAAHRYLYENNRDVLPYRVPQ